MTLTRYLLSDVVAVFVVVPVQVIEIQPWTGRDL
jgi:hypothetical protein